MNVNQSLKIIKELNENCEEVLDSLSAIHGKHVATAVYCMAHIDRSVSSIASLTGDLPDERRAILLRILTMMHDQAMQGLTNTLCSSLKSDNDVASVLGIMTKIFERQRDSMEKAMHSVDQEGGGNE